MRKKVIGHYWQSGCSRPVSRKLIAVTFEGTPPFLRPVSPRWGGGTGAAGALFIQCSCNIPKLNYLPINPK